jgi:hypothetical protein
LLKFWCAELGDRFDRLDVLENGCSWFSPREPAKEPVISKNTIDDIDSVHKGLPQEETGQNTGQGRAGSPDVVLPRDSSGLTRLYAVHPIMVAKRIREAIGDRSQRETAKLLGIQNSHLSEVLTGVRALPVKTAVRLHLIGIGGLELYLGQEIHRYLCVAYHTEERGDPIGKHHFEDEEPVEKVLTPKIPVAEQLGSGIG